MKTLLLVLMLSATLGCAMHRTTARLVEVIVPRASLMQDPVMLQCDLRVDPPKCKTIKLVYRKGAAQIKLK